jgi:hypothetical protein
VINGYRADKLISSKNDSFVSAKNLESAVLTAVRFINMEIFLNHIGKEEASKTT